MHVPARPWAKCFIDGRARLRRNADRRRNHVAIGVAREQADQPERVAGRHAAGCDQRVDILDGSWPQDA